MKQTHVTKRALGDGPLETAGRSSYYSERQGSTVQRKGLGMDLEVFVPTHRLLQTSVRRDHERKEYHIEESDRTSRSQVSTVRTRRP